MIGVILNFIRWLFKKFAAAVLIAALGFAACALWLFLHDDVDFDVWRQDELRTINGERAKVQAALDDVHKKMDRLSAEMASERQRGEQADKVIAQLKDLQSTWDRFVGNPEQQKANTEQLAKVSALRQGITARLLALQLEFNRTTWERDGQEIAMGKLDQRLESTQEDQSKVLHYLDRTWNYPLGRGILRLPIKWWMVVALACYFVGPSLGKFGLYYFVAPRIERGRPVRFASSAPALPEVSESKVAVEITLGAGERLWVKEKFLPASDEGLEKKTRYLLDWRVPFTCLATGLVKLIEVKNAAPGGDAERRLTLSNQGDPHGELAVIVMGETASLILRPSFLVGAVTASGQRLRIRRRWQLFRWQAWTTRQFRYFEFVGPCRLIVAGKPGVRAERLSERVGDEAPARRANQDATMGFTPNLDYRPARAESFWSYYRGMNPLFDDLFMGQGIFLSQQVAEGEAREARKFWAGMWGGAMKVFGM